MFGVKHVEYSKYQKKFKVEGWPVGIAFRQPYDYGKHQVNVIMESKDAIKFVPIEMEESDNVSVIEPSPLVSTPTEKETEPMAQGHLDPKSKSKPRARKTSFVKKGDVVPCISDQGGFWLFQCLSKVKTNGKIKGKWLDSMDSSRRCVILDGSIELDERTVLLKDDKRMVVPKSYFERIEKDEYVLSVAGYNLLNDLLHQTET